MFEVLSEDVRSFMEEGLPLTLGVFQNKKCIKSQCQTLFHRTHVDTLPVVTFRFGCIFEKHFIKAMGYIFSVFT